MFNIIHAGEGFKFDFILKNNDGYSAEQFRRRTHLKIDGFHAWTITAEDLIISKLRWIQDMESTVQLKDLRELIALANTDMTYVKKWCRAMQLKTFDLF